MLNKRADKLELLRIAEEVALEKSIDKELIISSMETGIAKAAKSKFGQDNEIKVVINRDNGDIEIYKMGLRPFFFGANKNMLNKRADKLELLRIAEAVAL